MDINAMIFVIMFVLLLLIAGSLMLADMKKDPWSLFAAILLFTTAFVILHGVYSDNREVTNYQSRF